MWRPGFGCGCPVAGAGGIPHCAAFGTKAIGFEAASAMLTPLLALTGVWLVVAAVVALIVAAALTLYSSPAGIGSGCGRRIAA